jgi:hypothetical protein
MKEYLMERDLKELKMIWKESKLARRYEGPEGAIILRPRDQEQLIDVLLNKCNDLQATNDMLKAQLGIKTADYFDKEPRYAPKGTYTLQCSEVRHNNRKKNFSLY